MSRSSVLLLTAILALVSAAPLRAADPPAAAPAGPNTQQFTKLYAEWKDLLAEMWAIHEEYRSANDDRKAQIENRDKELTAKGDALRKTLIDAAEKAYVEAPKANADLPDFLMKVVDWSIKGDRYEQAVRLAEALVNGGYQHKNLANCYGIGLFAVSRFDEAEKQLKQAAADNAASEEAQKCLFQLPDCKKFWLKEEPLRAAEAKKDDLPRVLLKTSKGPIELELFENEAPVAVANFISLVDQGFYNGKTFHRVLRNFMAQGGCPRGDGSGGPGYCIPCECHQPNARMHFRGTLSMAHAGRDTGGSQFFLTFLPTGFLNGKHTAFGRVVKGLDVLAELEARDPDAPNPPTPDRIIEAKVLRKRPHAYAPTKLPPR